MKDFGRQRRGAYSQGAIVSNKLLAGALRHIKQEQEKKDIETLRRLRTTREKQLLRRRAEALA